MYDIHFTTKSTILSFIIHWSLLSQFTHLNILKIPSVLFIAVFTISSEFCNESLLELQEHILNCTGRAACPYLRYSTDSVVSAPSWLFFFQVSSFKLSWKSSVIIRMSSLVSWGLKLGFLCHSCDVIWPWPASQIAEKVASWLFHDTPKIVGEKK